jgi:hypothetical protein
MTFVTTIVNLLVASSLLRSLANASLRDQQN